MDPLLSKVKGVSITDSTSTISWLTANCVINCLSIFRTELKLFKDIVYGWTEQLARTKSGVQTQVYEYLVVEA
jgi:hypothetical protein